MAPKASTPTGNRSDKAATPAQVTQLVMAEAQRRGLNWFQAFHAAGMVGSFSQETGNFRRDVLNFSVRGDDGSAHGLMQWRGKRYQNLVAYSKSGNRNPADLSTQISFAFEEMNKGSPYADFGSVKALGEFQKARTAQDTALAFIHAERPAGYDGNVRNAHDAANRVGLATNALNAYTGAAAGGGGGAQEGQAAGQSYDTGGGFQQPNTGAPGTDSYMGGDMAQNQTTTDTPDNKTMESDRFGLNAFINDKSNNPFLAGKETKFKAAPKPRFSAFGASNGGYNG